MIIWINGAFGSGKTQTACALQRRLPESFVYDPEETGFFIRKNIPKIMCKSDSQDHPLWRKFNYDMLDEIAGNYQSHIIVPMTITNRQYYDEIIGALSKKYEVKHFILCAEEQTLLCRLASRLEGKRSWAAQQIERCVKAFDEEITEYKIHTDDLNIDQVAERIAELCEITLQKDHRTPLRKHFDRLFIPCKHIRT